MLHGDFYINIVPCPLAVDDLIVQRCFSLVEIGHELSDPAFIVEDLFLLLFPIVPQDDLQILGQESGLPQTDLQGIVIKDRLLKDRRIWQETDSGPMLFWSASSCDLKLLDRFPPLVSLMIDLAVPADIHFQPF